MEEGEAPQPQLTAVHRAMAAAGASVVSAFVVNPLDVVKVGGGTLGVGVQAVAVVNCQPPAAAAASAACRRWAHQPPLPSLQTRLQAQRSPDFSKKMAEQAETLLE